MQTNATFGRRAPAQVRPPAPAPRAPAPSLDAADRAAGEEPLAEAARQLPWLTLGLILALVLAYLAELAFNLGGSAAQPSYATLVALGGVDRALTLGHGQWWRLLTAPLLHGSPSHLAGNAVVLLLAGLFLEPLIGRRWFVASLALGGAGGSIASISLNAPQTLSVGASGAIMSVLACTFLCSFHDSVGDWQRKRMRGLSWRIALPALLPLSRAAGHTDYSAHLGGVATGLLLGALLLLIWPADEDRPAYPRVAGGVGLAGGAATAVALLFAAIGYPAYAARAAVLAPIAELPSARAHTLARAPEVVARYPRDPRARLYLALAALEAGAKGRAEQELRVALQDAQEQADLVGPGIEPMIGLALALAVSDQGRAAEARVLAQPYCASARATHSARTLQPILRAGVCS